MTIESFVRFGGTYLDARWSAVSGKVDGATHKQIITINSYLRHIVEERWPHGDKRETRILLARKIVGRNISTTKEITKGEASAIIFLITKEDYAFRLRDYLLTKETEEA